jgi:hypothetical protein
MGQSMVLRRAVLLLMTVCGCVSPQVVVTAPPQAQKSPPPRDGATFGAYVSVPGTVTPLHGQVLPKSDVPVTMWPDRVVERPTETLIQPQAYAPRRTEKLTPTESPVVLAVRAYLDGRTDVAANHLQTLSPANQQAVMTLLPALATAGRNDLTADAALFSSQVEGAAEAAAKAAPLKIRKACYVSKVMQYGVYSGVPESHVFLPGGGGVLYLELQNPPSVATPTPSDGPGYVTRLECALHVQTADGKAVTQGVMYPSVEYTLSPVRDYFLKVEFAVPREPGAYTVVVDVRDPANNRKARHAVPMRVGK